MLDPFLDLEISEKDFFQIKNSLSLSEWPRNGSYYSWRFGKWQIRGERDGFERWKLIREELPVDLSSLVAMDLGCNDGYYTILMKLLNFHRSIGIDNRSGIIQTAKRIAEILKVQVFFDIMDLKRILVQKLLHLSGGRKADVLLLLSVLHHTQEEANIFSKCQNLLSENGSLFIEIPLKGDPHCFWTSWTVDGFMILLHKFFGKVKIIAWTERSRPLFKVQL